MLLQERRREEQQTTVMAGGDGPGGGTGGIDQAQTEGQRLLDVADDLLSRALSGNSEAFLAANRQQGGQ